MNAKPLDGAALVVAAHFPSVKTVASDVTPVPGGVGLYTLVSFVSNTVQAARLQSAEG
jgi:5,10-methylene-tetrahydrofolate dehydrogenase/methenyl tetrahydrofolate cyclohydrolase